MRVRDRLDSWCSKRDSRLKKVILARLTTIVVPTLHSNLVIAGMISEAEISIEAGNVVVPVNVPPDFKGDLGELQKIH